MSCLQLTNSIQNDCLSNGYLSNSNSITDSSSNLNSNSNETNSDSGDSGENQLTSENQSTDNLEENQSTSENQQENIKLKLRSRSIVQKTDDDKIADVPKLTLFDQLIKEAKSIPTTDFELSSLFFEQLNDLDNELKDENLDSKRSVNYLESYDQCEFRSFKKLSNFTNRQPNMKDHHSYQPICRFSSKENHTDSRLRELRNFKNLKANQNSLNRTLNKNQFDNLKQFSIIKLKSIDKNSDMFNDVNTDAYLDKLGAKPTNSDQINDSANLNQNSIHNFLFKLNNETNVFEFYTFQDKASSDLDQDSSQTSIIALIQLEQISIWTKLVDSTECSSSWSANIFKLEDSQQVFRCTKVDKETYVCIIFLVYSHSLISLKYCFIDKQTKSVQLKNVETFEISTIDLNLIQLCFINPSFLALSIPRNEEIIDVLTYYQIDFEQAEFNKDLKRIIYMLNNVNNKFSSPNNTFLSSDELDNHFLAIFNQKLFMCNVNEYDKIPKMISLRKYANLNNSYFDVLYDKGIFYIFVGDPFSCVIRIIALNIERCLTEKLMKYDIEKVLNDDKKDDQVNERIRIDKNLRIVKLFKRKGDHLLIIKNDNTLVLFNLFTDEIVYQAKLLNNLDQTSIAVLKNKTTILAVLNNEFVVNIVDL